MDIISALTQTLHSKCVTICAGNDGHELRVHEAVLLNSGSPSLKKLLRPDWKERSSGRIEWKHTNLHTIERVLTFLYYGDYDSPNPTLRRKEADKSKLSIDARDGEHIAGLEGRINGSQDVGIVNTNIYDAPAEELDAFEPEAAPEEAVPEEAAPEEEIPAEYEGDEDHDVQNAILQSCTTRPLTPLGRCTGLSPITTMRKTAGGVFEDQEFPYRAYSYRAPLLAHAEVYSFAKYHLLPALQNLALQRMTQTLRRIDCSVEHAEEDFSAVIEFFYDNIPSSVDDKEPMQNMLSQFAAIHYPSLLHGKFDELFYRGGEFTRDVSRKLSRRISAHGVAAEIEDDKMNCRIEDLEKQIQGRDDTIRSLNASLKDALAWGRGLTRKGNRR